MAEDIIETILGSVVQHGHHNNRIYLMQLNTDRPQTLIPVLDDMARKHIYGKISAKIPASHWRAFDSAGYEIEATIPGFFRREIDALFVAKYFSSQRKAPREDEEAFGREQPTRQKAEKACTRPLRRSLNIAECRPADAAEICAVYRKVFTSYPFPIRKPAFIERVMTAGTLYFCIRIDARIAAVAAAEIDRRNRAAEMTDFATLPQWRGRGCARRLLGHMHGRVRDMGIKTAFTIARAAASGMNAVFRNSGYTYAGMLKNNSQICGTIESMRVWYKHLQ
jgi:putative beta-lysine N-acetyltransferase